MLKFDAAIEPLHHRVRWSGRAVVARHTTPSSGRSRHGLPDLDNIAAVEKLLGRFDGRRILAMLNEASSFDARFCRASQ
jgi:hypothetical protein